MAFPVYYVEEGDVLPHLFDSYDGGTGASITLTGLAVTDIEIYKDGSTTQRSSDAGVALLDTDGIDFDGVTGIHGFSIDLSNNTDSGFYAVGSWYHVVVASVTIDAQTVNFVACAFRILSATRGMTGTALPAVASGSAGAVLTAGTGTAQLSVSSGRGNADVTHIATAAVSTTTAQLGVNVVQISTDAGAADNLEAAYDGAGYAGGTIKQVVDVGAISGDTAAADNLETAFDGGSYNAGGGGIVVASVTGNLGGNVNGNVGGNVTGSVGTVNALAANSVTAAATAADFIAEINAQMLDVLNVDTFAEPTGIPASTATLVAKIGALYMIATNLLEQTSSLLTLYQADGVTPAGTANISLTGGTLERGELG